MCEHTRFGCVWGLTTGLISLTHTAAATLKFITNTTRTGSQPLARDTRVKTYISLFPPQIKNLNVTTQMPCLLVEKEKKDLPQGLPTVKC